MIARVLGMLRTDFLLACECWFGGGTKIVMKNDEYRLSLDVSFLCSSRTGYADVRKALVSSGAAGIFDGPVATAREFRCDLYGLRSVLELDGQRVKFEIVNEGRVDLTGDIDPILGCPTLSMSDQFTEKLLANSDRGMDPSTAHRDLIDLGMLAISNDGRVPRAAVEKSSAAYFDVVEKVTKVGRSLLGRSTRLTDAATALQMDPALARKAVEAAIKGVMPWTSDQACPGLLVRRAPRVSAVTR